MKALKLIALVLLVALQAVLLWSIHQRHRTVDKALKSVSPSRTIWVSQEGLGDKDGRDPANAMGIEKFDAFPSSENLNVRFMGSIFYKNYFVQEKPKDQISTSNPK